MKTVIYMLLAAVGAFVLSWLALVLLRPEIGTEQGLGIMLAVAAGAALAAAALRAWQTWKWGG